MELDDALLTYITESRELLEEMEDYLLKLQTEQSGDQQEYVNAIFRAAHTIKGSAGLFSLDDIVEFTHVVESLLDQIRDGLVTLNLDIITILFSCRDHISDLVDLIENNESTLSSELKENGDTLVAQLATFSTHEQQAEPQSQIIPSQNPTGSVERINDSDNIENDNWHISLRFGENSFRDGMDPISFFRYLATIGEIVHIQVLDDGLPSYEQIDAESCYLGFEINFKADTDKETIEAAFEFIREESLVRIIPPRSKIEEYLALIDALPEEEMRIGEILVSCGSLTQNELDEALNIQNYKNHTDEPIGNIIVQSGIMATDVVDAAVEKQTQVRENKNKESQSIRVDAKKLDHLINLIGELVIAGAGASLESQNSQNSAVTEAVSNVMSLVEDVRDSALQLRMVQIGATFNRFQRVVRDVSKELGKKVDLKISGAETELDKTVVEKIVDPLMHLVRNALDHGIKTPEYRLERGKSERGTIHLNAYHDSGNIVIEISDDGAGIQPEKILQKAIASGLIEPDAQLDTQSIYNLIFEPGFSTAENVSNLSGRGVGMDVVKRNITELRGSVDVNSTPGVGTTFTVRMPLTLAIIDGFLVSVNDASFVVPLEMVQECIELTESSLQASNGQNFIDLRGEVLPFIRMRELFEIKGEPPKRESVVVAHSRGQKVGLVVDRLHGEFQTVIKPLGEIFQHVNGLGGSTILGNGDVALIIDVAHLINTVSKQSEVALNLSAI